MQDFESKFLHLSAGYGFGKSRTLVLKLLELSKLNAPFAGGIVVPSYTDFTRDVKIAFEDIFHEHNIKAEYHGSEHKYKLPWTKGPLYVATAEKKIRGPNWAYAGINELTLISMERFREVIGRVRVKGAKAPQIVSSGTPEGIASEYYSIFVEKPWPNSRILYGDTRENAHNLDPSYIQSLFDSYPTQLIDAYLKGLWVNLTGNRFYFTFDKLKNHSDKERDDSQPYYIGIDFNVDPMCATVWQKHGNKLYCVDEVVLKDGNGYRTENLVEALQARGYGTYNSILYPDPAGQARSTKGFPDHEILRRAGYQVIARKVAPRLRERQVNVCNLFEKQMIWVNTKKTPTLTKDLLAVEQDPATLEKKKNNPALTHASDSMDYLISELYPFNGHKTQTIVERLR
jgi:hypothetical protein